MPPQVCPHLNEKVVLQAKTWVSKSMMQILTQLQLMRELTQLREMIEVNDERPWRISGKASLHHHLVVLQLPNPQTDVCTGVEEYLNEEEQKR